MVSISKPDQMGISCHAQKLELHLFQDTAVGLDECGTGLIKKNRHNYKNRKIRDKGYSDYFCTDYKISES